MSTILDCNHVTELFERYGPVLAKTAQDSLQPLHVPGRDPLDLPLLRREPFEAQAHVIQAGVRILERDDQWFLVAKMGCGKTLMAMAAVHAHAKGQPYRALVVCPGQLVKKWKRELEETLPLAKARILANFRDVVTLERTPPTGACWYIISRDRAKLSSGWRPAYVRRQLSTQQGTGARFLCPSCHQPLRKQNGTLLSKQDLEGSSRKRWTCLNLLGEEGKQHTCGEQLWQDIPKPKRHSPARYIRKKMKGYFGYLVVDEAHELKEADSVQGDALGLLAAACKKKLILTGTLIGGYAWHVRALLFRTGACQGLVDRGLGWSDVMAFNEAYGRIETTMRFRSNSEDEGPGHRNARGGKRGKSTSRAVKPGIVPRLLTDCLLPYCTFLDLAEIAADLPKLEEIVVPVDMDAELAAEVQRLTDSLAEANKRLLRLGVRALLGPMLNCLLAYPDMPYEWGQVGYTRKPKPDEEGNSNFMPIVLPASLDRAPRNKEQQLLDIVQAEKLQGRQCWVYVQYTDVHNVASRVQWVLETAGLKVKVLRSSVEPALREEWIERHGRDVDVVISHPALVKTGLDLFSKAPGGHNFVTLIFYETGYDLFTMQQAARRSWRIGQKRECRVYYLYYRGSMQETAMGLMGRKQVAAEAIEGKFSGEGLAALADGDDNMEMALARRLSEKIDDETAERTWNRVTQASFGPKAFRLREEDIADMLAFAEELGEI